jgi:putative ABC transport system permease protein
VNKWTNEPNEMIRNYIKIAWRSLTKQKLYSLINISGLAVGLAVCMLIMLYVVHEMSYDRFHKNADRIFLPNAHLKMGDISTTMDYTSFVTGPLIIQSQPTVEGYMRTLSYFRPVIVSDPSKPSEKFSEENLVFADPGFFNFFSFKLIDGNANDVLKKPFSVVISSDMAKKYFGSQNAIGKTLVIRTDSIYTYQVTGVAESAPSNSTIQFNFVASNSSLLAMKNIPNYMGMPMVGPGSFNTYLLLKHASDTAKLRHGMDVMLKNSKQFIAAKFSLTGLPATHLNSFGDSSNLKYLKIFPIVAVLAFQQHGPPFALRK